MTATMVRQLERAREQLRGLTAGPTVPDPIDLFRLVAGSPDPWQVSVLQSTARRIILNCSRQSGKSTTAAVLAVHTALAVPGSLALVVSPSLRQSGELFRKCIDIYAAAGRPVPPDSETKLSLELLNGSRLVSLPGREQTIRGYSSVALLIEDEAARVDDALHASTRPMLAISGGRHILMSTPFGMRGHFHQTWTEGDGWERFQVPASDCPRISAQFLAGERRALGELHYRSEYLTEFCDVDASVFSSEDIRAALDPAVLPLFGGAVA